jgi:hypothetical protein
LRGIIRSDNNLLRSFPGTDGAIGRTTIMGVCDRIGGQAWFLVGMISSIIEQPQRDVIDQPGATPWEQVTPWRVSPERAE